jgi:CopG family transcriptional regulator, nickel-responsive regulator
MGDRVVRFGVSLPSGLVERFDRRIGAMGYASRSKAITDALSDFLTQGGWKADKGVFIGTISYAYDHHSGNVTHVLTSIQHDFGGLIRSTMHSHINHQMCVEVMIVEGGASEIAMLHGKISAARGVSACKVSALSGA